MSGPSLEERVADLVKKKASKDYHPFEKRLTFTISQNVHDVPDTVMSLIVESKPDGEIILFDIKKTSFASWTKRTIVSEFQKGFNWKHKMGPVRNQGEHETCWAIVASELISALRFIRKDDGAYTEYSSQFLVDYACPEKARIEKDDGHYCYPHTIMKALRFVQTSGLPLESHWTYKGCRKAPPPIYTPPPAGDPRVYIASAKSLKTMDIALQQLQFNPIGAALYIFDPEYYIIGGDIYRGPIYKESKYRGMHAVSIIGVTDEKGEAIAHVKSTHGEEVGNRGYFRVSLDVVLIEVPPQGTEAHKDYLKPRHLLSRFCTLELPPR
ncbi:unnamed protein product [Arabidopsis halleri]